MQEHGVDGRTSPRYRNLPLRKEMIGQKEFSGIERIFAYLIDVSAQARLHLDLNCTSSYLLTLVKLR